MWNRLQDKNQIKYEINLSHPVIDDFIAKLPEHLHADFTTVLDLAESTLPLDTVFADIGNSPELMGTSLPADETLERAVATTVAKLTETGVPIDDIVTMLQVTEPFRSNWHRVAELIAALQQGGPNVGGE